MSTIKQVTGKFMILLSKHGFTAVLPSSADALTEGSLFESIRVESSRVDLPVSCPDCQSARKGFTIKSDRGMCGFYEKELCLCAVLVSLTSVIVSVVFGFVLLGLWLKLKPKL